MKKQQPSEKRASMQRVLPRREALKGLGALAVTAPALAAIGCSSDSEGMGSPVGMQGAGTGATPAASAAGSGTATGSAGTAVPVGAAGSATGAAGATPSAPAVAGRSGSPTVAGSGASGAPAGSAAGRGASGMSGGAAGGGGSSAGSSAMAGASGSAGTGEMIPVTFDDVTSCTLTPTDPAGEGPFFLHEDEVMNDPSLKRSDIRDGKPGIELQLNLRVLDSEGGCMKPIAGVEVYVWHTDATGFYSGFNDQDPNKTYTGGIERTVQNGDRFCRGIQLTDKDGIVRFKTVYPGWYNGRAIHIHFVALRPMSKPDTMTYRSAQYMVFTTQMYFQEQFSRMIHENNAPYNTRSSGSGYNQYVKPQNMVVVPKTRMEGNIAIGALNIVTAGSGSRR